MKESPKEKQMHTNHRNRMKNIFVENGFSAFSEIQKLEFLLFFAIPQKDVNPLAHKLLDRFGSISNVLAANFDELVSVDGIGKHTALLLKTYFAISQEKPDTKNMTRFEGSGDAKKFCYNLLKNSKIEEFYVVCLDDCHRVLKYKKLNTGSNSKVKVSISEITRLGFSLNASEIIVAHNHPSGNAKFSDEDITLSHSIACNCLLNELHMIDHVLVTPDAAYSLAESGEMQMVETAAIKHMNISAETIARICSSKTPYVVNNSKK